MTKQNIKHMTSRVVNQINRGVRKENQRNGVKRDFQHNNRKYWRAFYKHLITECKKNSADYSGYQYLCR